MERNPQPEQRLTATDNEEVSRVPTGQDAPADMEVPKPAYSHVYGKMDLNEGGLDAQAAVTGAFLLAGNYLT
jgi:hypothetical protein